MTLCQQPDCGQPSGTICTYAMCPGRKLRVLDLFSGIGGFSLGLERTGGFETVAFCEIEEFPRKVLAKHWPDVPCYRDVRELTAERLAADGIALPDIICGGFPCQDISIAGRGRGLAGERSGLWFEFDRIIGEFRPPIAVMENVGALLHRGLDAVLGCLAERGYDAWWRVIPAWAVSLPHVRERVWILAYADQIGWAACRRIETALASQEVHWTPGVQMELRRTRSGGTRWLPDGIVCHVDNGLSANVDGIGAGGNAVVPQIPELIGRAILQAEHDLHGGGLPLSSTLAQGGGSVPALPHLLPLNTQGRVLWA
jgi:DNA (cytosine-5)-methyltransferase 1